MAALAIEPVPKNPEAGGADVSRFACLALLQIANALSERASHLRFIRVAFRDVSAGHSVSAVPLDP